MQCNCTGGFYIYMNTYAEQWIHMHIVYPTYKQHTLTDLIVYSVPKLQIQTCHFNSNTCHFAYSFSRASHFDMVCLHCKNKGVMVTPILGVKWLCENDTTFGVSNAGHSRSVS